MATDANTIHNMRSPSLDLDNLYGRGPGLDPFLYVFPNVGPSTAIKLQRGTNTNVGPGGPSSTGAPGGMLAQTNWDVPRIPGTNTAVKASVLGAATSWGRSEAASSRRRSYAC